MKVRWGIYWEFVSFLSIERLYTIDSYCYLLLDTLNGEHKQMICKKSVVSIALNLVPIMLELAFPYASRSQNFLHPTRRRALITPIVTASYSTTTIRLLKILLKPLPFHLFFVVVVAVFASPQAEIRAVFWTVKIVYWKDQQMSFNSEKVVLIIQEPYNWAWTRALLPQFMPEFWEFFPLIWWILHMQTKVE